MTPPSARSLTEADQAALAAWTPPPVTLPSDAELRHQLRLAMAGVESTAVLGEWGTGKSRSCERLVAEVADDEVQHSFRDPTYVPRSLLVYESATAEGRKTGLTDLCDRVAPGSISPTSRRMYSPTDLVELAAEHCRRQRVHAIVIDEAHKITPHNLDLIRQVPDAARRRGHTMGILYVGPPVLRARLIDAGQLGHRVSAEVHLERLTASQVAELLPGWHPHLTWLEEVLGARRWGVLVERVHAKSCGSIRRVDRIVENAHHLALAMSRWADEYVVGLAIDKLADER